MTVSAALIDAVIRAGAAPLLKARGFKKTAYSDQDVWWAITASDDHAAIAAEVRLALEELALPYLDRISTLEGLAEHGGHHPLAGETPYLAVASALAKLGRNDEAMSVFASLTAHKGAIQAFEQAWLDEYRRQA